MVEVFLMFAHDALKTPYNANVIRQKVLKANGECQAKLVMETLAQYIGDNTLTVGAKLLSNREKLAHFAVKLASFKGTASLISSFIG